MTLQHITLAEVKEACRKAYAENRLLAQNPSEKEYGYSIRGNVCAIGAALTPETLSVIDSLHGHWWTLNESKNQIQDNEVFSWAEEEHKPLVGIQKAHDTWLGIAMGEETGSVSLAEAKFLYLIVE